HGRRAVGNEHVDLTFHHLCHQHGKSIVSAIGAARLDDEVLAFDVAQLTQPVPECGYAMTDSRRRKRRDKAHPNKLLRRLRRMRDNGGLPCEDQHDSEQPKTSDHRIASSVGSEIDCTIVRSTTSLSFRSLAEMVLTIEECRLDSKPTGISLIRSRAMLHPPCKYGLIGPPLQSGIHAVALRT